MCASAMPAAARYGPSAQNFNEMAAEMKRNAASKRSSSRREVGSRREAWFGDRARVRNPLNHQLTLDPHAAQVCAGRRGKDGPFLKS